MFRDATKHPFPASVLWIAGTATLLVGGGVTGGAYANATVLYNHYAEGAPNQSQVNDYENARNIAYASWAVPAALTLATVVLAIWYAAGTKHLKVPVITGVAF